MSTRFFFFEQKTAYELRISDWSSDVCSSDLRFFSFLCFGNRFQCHRTKQRDAAVCHGFSQLRYVHRRTIRLADRSEESRVGQEGVSPCSSRWSPYHSKNNRVITRTNLIDTFI